MDDAELRLQEIRSAVDTDFYEKALNLIEKGIADYPGDFRFPMVRGDLYEEQELYTLALESYKEAEVLDMTNSVELRMQLASTLGYLDQNFESLSYLESLVDEGESTLLDDLGWMYYKTHQPEKGIVRIRESLEKDFDRNLSLTLGTLYSEINSPDLCRKYYLDAILDALEQQDSYFASVGYYNLSLAEKSFYDYEAAVDYATQSLELMDRAAGHLALGDLYMMKQSYIDAEREFREAVGLDKTPLSRTNLASLYRVQGRLDESLMEIRKIEEDNDESWMYYYGLNQDQFVMDLYRQFFEVYEGKVQQQLLFREWGVSARGRRLLQLIENKGKALYYRTLYRNISFREGRSQLEGGSELRGSLTLASGSEGFPRQAEKYYLNALALEDFPQAEPWYDLVLGKELKDKDLLARAEQGLNPEWERQPLEDVLRSRVLLMRGNSREKNDILMKMYQMNPGSLVQYGLRLPLELQLSGEKASGLQKRRLESFLKQSGFRLIQGKGNALVLRISISDSIKYTMSDPEGRVLYSGNTKVESKLSEELRDWVRSFRMQVFQF
nr:MULTISPECIES: tetratricopeptide repeat protein [unclassified Oceanispirochaeta]